MTEHEKLLAGLEYDYTDPEIQGLLAKARTLMEEYNALPHNAASRRREIVDELFASHGDDVTIQTPFRTLYGAHTLFGSHVFINTGCTLQDGGRITIGDRVVIAPNVHIYTGNHSLDARERWKALEGGALKLVTTVLPVTIGNDVWIGGDVTIVPGVRIGNNVVVAAGAVVAKDVPDNSLVGGVPARVIRALPALS